jgi:hypothetical protein
MRVYAATTQARRPKVCVGESLKVGARPTKFLVWA